MALPNDQTLFADETTTEKPVDCLGQTFPSEAARRDHYLGLLRERLLDPDFRATEGFPDASDEDILRLSDPPYYTACPNPFAADFVRHHAVPYDGDRDRYRRYPFSADVSEGKTDPLYQAHAYHTKVPHKAILRYIAHYTEPGDIVLDGFCGSGMTGVAAQLCASPDPKLREQIEKERKEMGLPKAQWGARRAVLNDLGPYPAFIAAGFNLPFDRAAFAREGRRLLEELRDELGWMYETNHVDGRTKGRINYTVWSEVFACPECSGEVVFVEEALDESTGRIRETFHCPHCRSELTRRKLERLYETYFDPVLGRSFRRPKRSPAIINYTVPGQKGSLDKKPDSDDLALIERAERLPLPPSVPARELPYMHMTHERARMDQQGVTHVHHFYLPRAARALGTLWEKTSAVEDTRLRNALLWFVEQAVWGMSVLNRYSPTHFSQVNRNLNGVYYIASQHAEVSPWYNLNGKLERLIKAFDGAASGPDGALVATGSAAVLPLPDQAVDYVFTDPPFGENIYYADLNYLTEAWYSVFTQAEPEAIVDRAKAKDLYDYKHLMQRCFSEYHRVLKPGRWITVVFHNSKNAVWNAIQEALQAAGFVVADVSVLDKKSGSYRQVTSDTTKQDLVINAYKPSRQFELAFGVKAGTEEGAWDFVRARLAQLPMPRLLEGGVMEYVNERSRYVLFDRMVAFHVGRGLGVPLSNAEFFAGLSQQFALRDDMFFLPEQVDAYDRSRLKAQGAESLTLIIKDEQTAIQWLRQELDKRPRKFSDLSPQFMKETQGWSKLEELLDLRDLLEQNFLHYDGEGPVPSQIHRYLSSNYHDLRSLEKDHALLRGRAAGRWYVPDATKAEDIEKIRDRELLKVFDEYRASDKKRIRPVRGEALRAGFRRAHREKDYRTILDVAERVPPDVIEEDAALLRFVDIAKLRAGDDAGPLFDGQ